MSYARFSGDSDVYVFLNVNGQYDCCTCALEPDSWSEYFASTQDLIDHLARHVAAGHKVPDYTFERLRECAEENDEWIAEEAARRLTM